MPRYEVVRDIPDDLTPRQHRHPDQPAKGFAYATDALNWCITPPRDLGGEWYIQPIEGT